jgi:hypothetical protein
MSSASFRALKRVSQGPMTKRLLFSAIFDVFLENQNWPECQCSYGSWDRIPPQHGSGGNVLEEICTHVRVHLFVTRRYILKNLQDQRLRVPNANEICCRFVLTRLGRRPPTEAEDFRPPTLETRPRPATSASSGSCVQGRALHTRRRLGAKMFRQIQGDQIERIFAYWAIVPFAQC